VVFFSCLSRFALWRSTDSKYRVVRCSGEPKLVELFGVLNSPKFVEFSQGLKYPEAMGAIEILSKLQSGPSMLGLPASVLI
jgi:hypothetical protein